MRRTRALALAAGGASCALLGAEVIAVTRRSSTRDALTALRQGYRAGSANESALLILFVTFAGTLGGTRAVTHMIREGVGPFGNVSVGSRHIHHFVPGIVVGLLAGGGSIVLRHEQLDQWLAAPFGAGAALVLDESALLLSLEDVYWTEEGVLSVQIGLGALAALAVLALGARMLRRGERRLPTA